jgi:hypothetical protein
MSQLTTGQFPTQDGESSARQSSASGTAAIIGPIIAGAALILVTLVMIGESRLTPVQRMGLFEASNVYP